MSEQVCGKPATYAIVWADKRIYQCEEHAQQVLALGRAIGHRPVCDPYIGPEVCSQHVRETVSTDE